MILVIIPGNVLFFLFVIQIVISFDNAGLLQEPKFNHSTLQFLNQQREERTLHEFSVVKSL